jgi:hypothetical protein
MPAATTLNATQLEQGLGFVGQYFTETFADNLTAHAGGGQANGLQLTAQNNRITTVATTGDSVVLPPSAPGMEIFVINHGSNPCQVYGLGSDTVNDVAAATGVQQMQNSLVLYICVTKGSWYTEGLANGFASGFQTFSSASGLTAHAGGGQGSATAITAMQNFFSTVATGGDSSVLPSAQVGMEIAVANNGAASMNVFPASGQTINNGAANASVAVAASTITIFFCGQAGAWWTKSLAYLAFLPLLAGMLGC